MRRILLISFLCLLAVVTSGCKKARLRAQLKELMGSTIVLPEKITCVYNGEVYPMPDSLRDRAKLIVYIDSTACTTCRIGHFWKYQDIFDLAEQTRKFEIILLLWNTEFESIPISRYLIDQHIKYPVYVDIECKFLTENPCIPNNQLFHCFLLNRQERVMFVGDPVLSEKMFEVFKRAIIQL